MSHTPGPWMVGDRVATGVFDRQGRGVASTGGYYTNAEEPDALHNRKVHDALLIAAAPELLGALEEMVATYGVGHTSSALQAARAAIAKAKGETK